jgi:drug/metabolite transporter (DMT)-like permease
MELGSQDCLFPQDYLIRVIIFLNHVSMSKFVILLITLNAVASQLALKRATLEIGSPQLSWRPISLFVFAAAQSPWAYAYAIMQIFGLVLWMILFSREKVGVATASVGAGFYLLIAFSSWMVYGETLTPLQWAGIVFVTLGGICISLGIA